MRKKTQSSSSVVPMMFSELKRKELKAKALYTSPKSEMWNEAVPQNTFREELSFQKGNRSTEKWQRLYFSRR